LEVQVLFWLDSHRETSGEPFDLAQIRFDPDLGEIVKLAAHGAGPFDRAHGPEHVEWASR
jgi:hypothetical protein